MLKRLVKFLFRELGYRLVPLNRDAGSFLGFIASQPIKTVIDVGASTGKTAEDWLARYSDAKVYGIEPLPKSFSILKGLEGKSDGRFKALNYAVGDTKGTSNMYFHDDHPTSSSLLSSTDKGIKTLPIMERNTTIKIEQITLDALFADGGLEKPILLKMDVQGYEGNVLRGATNLLKTIAFVLTEITVADCYENQCQFDELHNIMTKSGFKFMGFLEQFHLDDGTPVYADVVYVNEKYFDGKMHD